MLSPAGIVEASVMTGLNVWWAITWGCYIYVLRHRSWPPFVAKAQSGVGLVCLGSFFAISASIQTMNGSSIPTDREYFTRCVTAPIFAHWAIGLTTGAILGREWKLLSCFVWPHKSGLMSWRKFTTLIVLVQAIPGTLLILFYSIFVVPESQQRLFPGQGWHDTSCPMDMGPYGTAMLAIDTFLTVSVASLLVWLTWMLHDVSDFIHSQVSGVVVMIHCIATWVILLIQPPFGFYGVTVTGNLGAFAFWTSLGEAFRAHMKGDVEYLKAYTYGLSSGPTVTDLEGALDDQLEVPQLRALLVEIAKKHQTMECLEFIEDVLTRDLESDYEARYALTVHIIRTYIRVGSEKEVNISDAIRSEILSAQDLVSAELFRRARTEVRMLWEDNMGPVIKDSKGWKVLEKGAPQNQVARDKFVTDGILPGNRTRRLSVLSMTAASGGASQSPKSPRTESFSSANSRQPLVKLGSATPTWFSSTWTVTGQPVPLGDSASPRTSATTRRQSLFGGSFSSNSTTSRSSGQKSLTSRRGSFAPDLSFSLKECPEETDCSPPPAKSPVKSPADLQLSAPPPAAVLPEIDANGGMLPGSIID